MVFFSYDPYLIIVSYSYRGAEWWPFFQKKSVILGWILAQNSKFKMAAMRPPKGLEGQGSGDKVFSKGQIDTQVLNKIHGIDYDNQV